MSVSPHALPQRVLGAWPKGRHAVCTVARTGPPWARSRVVSSPTYQRSREAAVTKMGEATARGCEVSATPARAQGKPCRSNRPHIIVCETGEPGGPNGGDRGGVE